MERRLTYRAHFFEHLTDSLRSMCFADVEGDTIEAARAAASILLPTIHGAIGFRLCDGSDRQVDIYVPTDSIAPHG